MERIVQTRNSVNSFLYRNILKPAAFRRDPEEMHKFFVNIGKNLNGLGRTAVSVMFNYKNKMLEQNIFGIKFENPVGLSAGFDKNAELIGVMEKVGFGFVEVGSVTAKACEGNKGVRLKRIPENKSLWVNLGLNNLGVDEISMRLKGRKFNIPFGVSVAKTNSKETVAVDEGIKDYIYSLRKLEKEKVGDYYTLNVSCPNSYGGQAFSEPKLYKKLMKAVDEIKPKIKKPIFVKISPDLDKKIVDEIIEISRKHNISGFVCSNLTKKNNNGKGGFSGGVLSDTSDELLKYVARKVQGEFVLIGVGGIFSAEDAYKKIRNGAHLVQLITGMIYEGPNLISEINCGLVEFLKKDGFMNIEEAVG